jgi:hypothetical protein
MLKLHVVPEQPVTPVDCALHPPNVEPDAGDAETVPVALLLERLTVHVAVHEDGVAVP